MIQLIHNRKKNTFKIRTLINETPDVNNNKWKKLSSKNINEKYVKNLQFINLTKLSNSSEENNKYVISIIHKPHKNHKRSESNLLTYELTISDEAQADYKNIDNEWLNNSKRNRGIDDFKKINNSHFLVLDRRNGFSMSHKFR